MIQIQGYWAMNGAKTKYRPKDLLITEDHYTDIKIRFRNITGHELLFKMTKIPNEIKKSIIKTFLKDSNQTLQQIADAYGVSKSYVNLALTEYYKNQRNEKI